MTTPTTRPLSSYSAEDLRVGRTILARLPESTRALIARGELWGTLTSHGAELIRSLMAAEKATSVCVECGEAATRRVGDVPVCEEC